MWYQIYEQINVKKGKHRNSLRMGDGQLFCFKIIENTLRCNSL